MADQNQDKPEYIPAQMIFEGGGIQRGLTVPETAVLLGRPIRYALMSIVMALLQKGLIELVGLEPLEVRVIPGMRTRDKTGTVQERTNFRREAALEKSVVIHPYEDQLLELLEINDKAKLCELNFDIMIAPLVNHVSERLAGYSLDESHIYYESVVQRARKEIEEPLDGINPEKWFERKANLILLEKPGGVKLPRDVADHRPDWKSALEGEEIPTYARITSLLLDTLERTVSVESLSPESRLLKTENARQIMTGIRTNYP